MNVFYAGPVVNNWAEGLWPHAWHLGTPVPLPPGKSAFDYQFTAMGAELTLGTFCHENGHMLCDYPDLYDYGDESSGVGAFCLMCAGNNADEKNPTHDQRLSQAPVRLGRQRDHARARQPGHACGRAATTSRSSPKTDASTSSSRTGQRAGRDAALPDEGLAIWHVDEARRQQQRADDRRQPLRAVAGAGRRPVRARASAGQRRRRERPLRRRRRTLRRRHRARQQMVERHGVEPDHRPDLGRRRVDDFPLPLSNVVDAAGRRR